MASDQCVTTEEMEIKLASHINQCQAFWQKIQLRNIWILQHHNGSWNTSHAGQWHFIMNQILSPPPTTTFSNSLGHLAFPNSQDLTQRLSFCMCGRNPQEYKNMFHSHTKSFSGVSISILTAVANVCALKGSNVQVTR